MHISVSTYSFFSAHCSDSEVEGLFDSYSLFEDMLAHPALYLNGTAPLNTTGCVHSCVYQLNESTADTGACTIANGTDRDSFLWYVAICTSLVLFPPSECFLMPGMMSYTRASRQIVISRKKLQRSWRENQTDGRHGCLDICIILMPKLRQASRSR